MKSNNGEMRALFLMPRVCWPPQTGLMLRNYHLARALGREAEVTVLSFADDRKEVSAEEIRELPPPPEDWAARVEYVEREAGYTPAKLLRGAVGGKPVTVLNYTTEAMKQALARLLAEKPFDVVQVETSTLGAYLPVIQAARHRPLAVCDWHNIDSELMLRYSEKAPLMRGLYARLTARRIAAFEQWTLENYDAHIACSERDAEQLRETAPQAKITVIENGVDVDYYTDAKLARAHELCQKQSRKAQTANRILYVGSMDYHANIDAVTEFARNDWPAIHAQRPELSFTVVGRNPAPEVVALKEIPGVEITGTVPDVRPYYAEAVANVVPLRVGSGSRLKILEAMAAGVPVVSTTLGAEGLTVTNGLDIAIADDAKTMADQLFLLLDQPEKGRLLADAARSLVQNQYDWAALGGNLASHYKSLL
jgi:sugar transferase (PEP-CTERM/EpsH1 system associated)